jgi:hypothetical protein
MLEQNNEGCRKEGEEMDAGETRQGMGRQGQMEISLQQSTQEIGNDLRNNKKKRTEYNARNL